MQTECAVCWGAEFPLAGEAKIVGAVAGAVAGSVTSCQDYTSPQEVVCKIRYTRTISTS